MTRSAAAAVVHFLGVRHHGPGSARSVLVALDRIGPAMVLVEVPADTIDALGWIGRSGLEPPVALLGHAPDADAVAVFAPFASFSPEWCAITWANLNGVPVRAIDLPWSVTLAATPDRGGSRPIDPIGELAAAVGAADAERWWEDVVEHRGDDTFEAVADAMVAVRSGTVTGPDESRREAHMRRAIRAARRDVSADIAVVCGAWHVPVLDPQRYEALGEGPFPTAGADAAVLRGMPRTKVQVSWVPWTHRRLASAAYGAGVRSPGWYRHVFTHPGPDGLARFLVDAAGVQRDHGVPTSPDHLVAATRLAEVLAALRGRPRPGLDEALDALEAVTGHVDPVRDRIVIGHAVGSVPADAPHAPLVRDVASTQRRLRLPPADEDRTVELDLRTATGLGRSRLLHRLRLLEVPWGVLVDGRGSTGTFRETWRLRWEPELSVRLVERSGFGVTVAGAAASRSIAAARDRTDLASLADLVDGVLLADLPEAVGPVVDRLAHRAAATTDVGRVADALTPLSRTLRYGDVRGTAHAAIATVVDGLVDRVLAGLVVAARDLDDEAADIYVERLGAFAAALALADHPARGQRFDVVLRELVDPPRGTRVNARIQGRAARARADRGHAGPDVTARRLARALTPGTPAADGARFLDGFLAGSGSVLVHDAQLRSVLDRWLCSLHQDAFTDVVALLRRTASSFTAAERRRLGAEIAARPVADGVADARALDPELAAEAVVTVRTLLGLVAAGDGS